MMKHITSFKTLLGMLAMLVMGNITAAAEDKVYISDFSIAAGDELEIAINFDTEATDIRGIDGTIALPKGLSVVENTYGSGQRTKADETRANGFLTNFVPSNGYFKLRGMLSSNVITGTTGAVAFIKVKADAALTATSIIKLSGFQIEHADGTKAAAATANAIVTCTNAAPAANKMSVEPAEISLSAGATAEFKVNLANEESITGFDAVIDLPAGVTAKVEKTERLTGAIFSYNATSKKVTYWGATALSGNEGAVLNVTLTADESFAAPAKITVSDIHVTNAASTTTTLEPVFVNIVSGTISTEALQKEIEEAGKVADAAQADVAADALKALKDELEKAKTLAANTDGKKQADIDAETAALKAARDAYQMAAAKQALTAEIAKANALIPAGANKTVEPVKSLADAIAAAQAVYDKADATVAELQAATTALQAAEQAYRTATGIDAVKAVNEKNGAIYNLNGVRVSTPNKGIYIQNGKKIIIR